jgi:hypothetical protein
MDISVLVLGAAVATVSTTLSKTLAFMWLRLLIKPLPFLGALVQCPYCLGHWLSALGVITLFWNEGLLSLLLLWLLTTFLSGVGSGLLCWSLKEMESLKAKEESDAQAEAVYDSARRSLY